MTRHCKRCGGELREEDLKICKHRGIIGYYCKSATLCRWRMQRTLDARQTVFDFAMDSMKDHAGGNA